MAQSARDFLEQERNARLNEAKSIQDAADEAKRSLAPEERERIKALVKQAEDIREDIAQRDEDEKLSKYVESLTEPKAVHSVAAPGVKTLGEAIVNSESFQVLAKEGGFKTAKWTTGGIEVPFGAKESLPAASLLTSNSDVVQPDVQAGIRGVGMRRLTVADLMPSGSTDSNTVTVIVEEEGSTGSVNAAAAVTEGDEKPLSRLRLEEVPESVRKIATLLPVSDEMLDDVAGLRSFIDSRLALYVQHEEEDQLLNGNGTPPNLSGILDRSGIQTATQDSLVGVSGSAHDAVFEAITAIREENAEPSGLIINSTDWAGFRLAKDANNQYYGGGPFNGAYGQPALSVNALWGFPVVVTGAIAAGTVLVGAFATEAQVFRRGGLTVEASNSHDDFFRRNMVAIRAEERLALAVYKPAAFFAITGVEFDPSA